eukprot:scaffold57968_cov61-Phaeocystis_antarctica.AAC.3
MALTSSGVPTTIAGSSVPSRVPSPEVALVVVVVVVLLASGRTLPLQSTSTPPTSVGSVVQAKVSAHCPTWAAAAKARWPKALQVRSDWPRSSKTAAAWLRLLAKVSAETPRISSSVISAPAASKRRTIAVRPFSAAIISAVLPVVRCRSTLADACSSACTVAVWPYHAAHISAVYPRMLCAST